MEKRKPGRPIEKIGRIKIGLSIDGDSNYFLCEMSKDTGKNKSKIVEESLAMYYEHHKEMMEKLRKSESNDEDPYSQFRTMLTKSMSK